MTKHKEAVVLTIRILDRIHQEMGEIATRRDTSWKIDMVQKRREQSKQLTELSKALDRWLGELSDDEIRKKTKALFNNMRHAIVMTQTQWPLSKIDNPADMEGYAKVARETQLKGEQFFNWTKPLLNLG